MSEQDKKSVLSSNGLFYIFLFLRKITENVLKPPTQFLKGSNNYMEQNNGFDNSNILFKKKNKNTTNLWGLKNMRERRFETI